jgi:hypothetical protein
MKGSLRTNAEKFHQNILADFIKNAKNWKFPQERILKIISPD